MGIPEEAANAALSRVRAMALWSASWTWAAQRFLAEARQARSLGDSTGEAAATRRAARAYDVAVWMPSGGPKEIRTLRAAASALFARSLPTLDPATRRIDVPWRTASLPGYLVRPPDLAGPLPLVVMLNGLTTSKEEMLAWVEPFLWQGLAVVTLDWPGTGEAALHAALTPDCDDLANGVFALAEGDPGLDPRRVAVVGISLGGALATRIAATDRRIAATVAVTPPFDAEAWLPLAGPLLRDHLAVHIGGVDRIPSVVAGFALAGLVERVRSSAASPWRRPRPDRAPGGSDPAGRGGCRQRNAHLVRRGRPRSLQPHPALDRDAARWLAARLTAPSTRVDGMPIQSGRR
jgi:dienelactone hydrolase